MKVEEVEMETPIHHPDDCSRGSLVHVKQEEGVDRSKTEKCEAPRKGGLASTDEKRWKKSETESVTSKERGLAKRKEQKHQNRNSSSLESSQNVGQQYSSFEHTSESMTQQGTTGEGNKILDMDEENTEVSTDV